MSQDILLRNCFLSPVSASAFMSSTLRDFFSKKVSQCRKKTERMDPLVSPGIVCYAEKEEKPFWFSSLGQMIQLGQYNFIELLRTILLSWCGLKKKSL